MIDILTNRRGVFLSVQVIRPSDAIVAQTNQGTLLKMTTCRGFVFYTILQPELDG